MPELEEKTPGLAGLTPTSFGALPESQPQGGYQPNVDELLKKGHAETAKLLAKGLLVMLGSSIALHYACVMLVIFFKQSDDAKLLVDVLHSWLPVMSGLAGAATTYYFTRNR